MDPSSFGDQADDSLDSSQSPAPGSALVSAAAGQLPSSLASTRSAFPPPPPYFRLYGPQTGRTSSSVNSVVGPPTSPLVGPGSPSSSSSGTATSHSGFSGPLPPPKPPRPGSTYLSFGSFLLAPGSGSRSDSDSDSGDFQYRFSLSKNENLREIWRSFLPSESESEKMDVDDDVEEVDVFRVPVVKRVTVLRCLIRALLGHVKELVRILVQFPLAMVPEDAETSIHVNLAQLQQQQQMQQVLMQPNSTDSDVGDPAFPPARDLGLTLRRAYELKIDHIGLVFSNLCYVVNSFRRDQAKRAVVKIMQEQLQRRRGARIRLAEVVENVREMLGGLGLVDEGEGGVESEGEGKVQDVDEDAAGARGHGGRKRKRGVMEAEDELRKFARGDYGGGDVMDQTEDDFAENSDPSSTSENEKTVSEVERALKKIRKAVNEFTISDETETIMSKYSF